MYQARQLGDVKGRELQNALDEPLPQNFVWYTENEEARQVAEASDALFEQSER